MSQSTTKTPISSAAREVMDVIIMGYEEDGNPLAPSIRTRLMRCETEEELHDVLEGMVAAINAAMRTLQNAAWVGAVQPKTYAAVASQIEAL